MKKRKSVITLALIASILVLGVGYALRTIDLAADGDLKIAPDDSNFDVKITDAIVSGEGNTATVGDNLTATLHVETLKTVGDEVTATYTITNNSKAGINAKIEFANPSVTYTEDTAKGYYNVEATFDNNDSIAPTKTKTLIVKVTLVKAPLEDVTGTFKVSMTANAEAN